MQRTVRISEDIIVILWLPCQLWHLLYPFSLILVKMDDGIECWTCDLDPGSPSGAGQCRDENDKGKLYK